MARWKSSPENFDSLPDDAQQKLLATRRKLRIGLNVPPALLAVDGVYHGFTSVRNVVTDVVHGRRALSSGIAHHYYDLARQEPLVTVGSIGVIALALAVADGIKHLTNNDMNLRADEMVAASSELSPAQIEPSVESLEFPVLVTDMPRVMRPSLLHRMP